MRATFWVSLTRDFSQTPAQYSGNAGNVVVAQRMVLATTWDDFLCYGPRHPIAIGDGTGYDEPFEDAGPEY